ncbi:MAG: hypothetical protein K8R44_01090 [Sulfurimonas sp.]|nr:hypothetical protein [Sulfurimonas sp.]
MKKLLFLLFPMLLFAVSPFETEKSKSFDLSVFDTERNAANTQAINNKKIRCRYVCDKKLYKEQKIADAISFYKKTAK